MLTVVKERIHLWPRAVQKHVWLPLTVLQKHVCRWPRLVQERVHRLLWQKAHPHHLRCRRRRLLSVLLSACRRQRRPSCQNLTWHRAASTPSRKAVANEILIRCRVKVTTVLLHLTTFQGTCCISVVCPRLLTVGDSVIFVCFSF